MGVVNTTPDSFSDGGLYFDSEVAVAHGLQLWEEGADIVDVGGASTRPGAEDVSESEEVDRTTGV
ncbi:MAG: dihydropteroate synthase, partial [Acidimicrobiia bacterium]|nr:dihydropteroate synthase [Acidimicrobiia bacterium]